RRPAGGETLAEDAQSRPVLGVAGPRDDEVAERVRSDGREVLVVRHVAVDAELRAEGSADRGVPLSEDAVARAVLEGARPCDDEAAAGTGRQGHAALGIGRKRIDSERRPDRRAGSENALTEDP